MNARKIYLLFFALPFFVVCCTQTPPAEKEIIAKVNEYDLLLKEFEDQLVTDLNFDEDFKLTKEAKREFLEQLIRKELLIQEATKLELHKREKFIKAIERYWEATLIRDVMELKGEEFAKRTYVSQEEIEARYKEIKKERADIGPIDGIRDDIFKEIAERKKREKLAEWIQHLRDDSNIHINEGLLNKN